MKIIVSIFVLAIAACFFYLAYALIDAAVTTFIRWFKRKNPRTDNDSQSWIDEYRERNNL